MLQNGYVIQNFMLAKFQARLVLETYVIVMYNSSARSMGVRVIFLPGTGNICYQFDYYLIKRIQK